MVASTMISRLVEAGTDMFCPSFGGGEALGINRRRPISQILFPSTFEIRS